MTQSFQYKILDDNLFLYKILFSFGFDMPSLRLFYNLDDETPFHLFFDCHIMNSLWTQTIFFRSF